MGEEGSNLTYQIGDQFPLDGSSKIVGPDIEKPTWFALTVPPSKEAATCAYLRKNDVHAIYPQRDSRRQVKGRWVVRKLPLVTRIVYARFPAEPRWHVMRARRLITGVFSRNGYPVELSGDLVRSIMGLPTVAQKLEEARRELLTPRVGEKAKLVAGPLAELMVDVDRVEAGKVWFSTITGMRCSVNTDGIQRVLPE